MLQRLWSLVLAVLLLLAPGWRAIALATDLNDLNNGAQIFSVHCVGCHINGGNIIRRGKTLKLKALKRYGMDSPAAIADLVTHGKLNMPAYGDRLSPEQIQAVTAYVLTQAEQNWR